MKRLSVSEKIPQIQRFWPYGEIRRAVRGMVYGTTSVLRGAILLTLNVNGAGQTQRPVGLTVNLHHLSALTVMSDDSRLGPIHFPGIFDSDDCVKTGNHAW